MAKFAHIKEVLASYQAVINYVDMNKYYHQDKEYANLVNTLLEDICDKLQHPSKPVTEEELKACGLLFGEGCKEVISQYRNIPPTLPEYIIGVAILRDMLSIRRYKVPVELGNIPGWNKFINLYVDIILDA